MSAARDRSARLSALVVLGALVVGGLVIDTTERSSTASVEAPVEAGVAMPAARPASTLASTWYCAAGTSDAGGFGDHVILIENPSGQARTATITALPGTIAPPPTTTQIAGSAGATTSSTKAATSSKATTTTKAPAVTVTGSTDAVSGSPTVRVPIPAQSRVAYRMVDLVQAPLVGAVVEVDGGEVSVEHELSGDLGKATAPCSTTVSAHWTFPWGVTTRGNRELLVFMNPFPDDATVDIAFATDEGVRDTVRFSGFVVPGRSVIGAYVDEDVTRKDQVSAQVTVRGGHLVIDRVQTFTGVDGRNGITVGLGAPVATKLWVFPDGYTATGLADQIVVYNPGTRVAEAQVEVRLDDPDKNGVPEPFDLTIPPQRYEIVDLQKEDRIPQNVGFTSIVSAQNGVPIVAERAVAAVAGSGRNGVSTTLGSPLGARTWYFPGGGTSAQRDEFLTLFNTSDHDAVTYSIRYFGAGQEVGVQQQQDITLKAGGRASIRLSDLVQRDDLPLVVTASGPIVAERGLYRVGGTGLSQSMGIPLGVDTVVPKDDEQ